jgi:hypothetical protein
MSGYNPATTNPWDVIRRQGRERDAATREALRPSGTQIQQATRRLVTATQRLSELDIDVEGLAAIAEAIQALQGRPVATAGRASASEFELDADTWTDVVTLTVPWFEDFDRADLQVLATGRAVPDDPATVVEARVNIEGVAGDVYALPVGADGRVPVLAAMSGVIVSPGLITIKLQLRATPPAVVPPDPEPEDPVVPSDSANFAALSAAVTFTP